MRISDWSSDVCSSDLQHDQCKTGGNHQHQPLAGRLEVLELTTPIEILAGREAHLPVDRLPRISNDTGNIAATHIGLNHDASLAVLAADLVGTIGNADVCNALEGHEPTIGEGHRNLCQRLQIGACHIRQADGDRKKPVTLDNHSGHKSEEGGGNSVLNGLGSDAEPRHDVTRSEEHTYELQSIMRHL